MSQQIGPFKRMLSSAGGLRLGMNLWPPFLFSGARILHISPDFAHVRVRLAKTPLTSNYFGTQFGGSLFSMTDPFWVIMLARNLGPDYIVWDRRGEIDFVAPGTTAVTSELVLPREVIDEVRAAADGGEKVLRWFENDVVDSDGTTIARVRKQVYVRRKPTR
ncbi:MULTISPECIES: DUF4442 domain-containing protein [unclassified Janibacter]|uniref:DUF4442 domain-containing protein n=1 Tax=unclassified Janibacter TaxID=2649294 RepID=UPI003D04ED60